MKPIRQLVLIVHNIRSNHNVGSLLRTAEGLGVERVILTGYTPYPLAARDSRLPHIAQKIDRAIHKTALGAEHTQAWTQNTDIITVTDELKADGFQLIALEQATHAVLLPDFNAPQKCALLVGREVEGIEQEVLALCDTVVEIPMYGKKESFNVAQAAAMALYHCTFQ